MRSELVTTTGVEVALRRAAAGDESFLRHLYADRRAPDVAALGWPVAASTAFLDMQFRAQQQAYGAAFPGAAHWIVTAGTDPVGRLLVEQGPVEHRVVDLVVLTRCRGLGIGTALMEEVLAEAARAGLSVRLVAATAEPRLPAWYHRLGFRVVERSDVDVTMACGPP